ncbi:MAG TPA: methionine synthase [Bacteroidales bacterium]|nr:methionine synthase [Bacteroidales bacterium]
MEENIKEREALSVAAELKKRVLVLDGAMGTMIQRYRLSEEDYRGERFRDYECALKGNNDLLVLTRSEVIREIHEAYLEAGADIIETNSFNANRISLADYRMESLAYELNFSAARLARETVDAWNLEHPEKPRWVAGSIGPTNKTASLSPDVQNPAYRAVTFDDLYTAYREQARGLLDGGADLLIVETIFDTLNAKAALIAVFDELEARRSFAFSATTPSTKTPTEVPVIASVTLSDTSGRTLSGQTLEAFLCSIAHFDLLAVGLNCSLGARELRPYLEELSEKAPFAVIAYPNAGLPNQFGEYDQSPDEMAGYIREFMQAGFLNMAGGCCGTTPEHIRRFVQLAKETSPRAIPQRKHELWLAGLEPLTVFKGSNFINIGERTNVSGSRKFARLIREEKYEEALSIARQQVDNGAGLIDISMDEALLDGEKAMVGFLNMLSSDPDVARVPVMIDSSRFSVIQAALKCIQGKPVVNSISLKEGETVFREQALCLRKFGAAVVVMAFDEAGQAVTLDRRIDIARRSYRILTEELSFPPEDILFDPNILTLATGIEEHNNYAVDFLEATRWIKKNLPHSRVSGGISNLSFSFRGNETLRGIMHAVFLYHAIRAGLDMGIVNAGALPLYDEIPPPVLKLVEDVILNRRRDATERLLAYAEMNKESGKKAETEAAWRLLPPADRLRHALIQGITDHIEEDIDELMPLYESALSIIEGPLMEGMNRVGERFGAGKMFLPQVVKSARVMKKAVARLTPRLEAEKNALKGKTHQQGKVLLATVKGDVHDIGKNIVAVVLGCNNYKIIDLGVMVPADKILETARTEKADIIGLSGLITPSLEEMVHVAREMQRQQFTIPLMIGGATTSEIHTAIKIDPVYPNGVVHVKDASRAALVVAGLLRKDPEQSLLSFVKSKYREVRDQYDKKGEYNTISLPDARKNKLKTGDTLCQPVRPVFTGNKYFFDYPLEEIRPFIDWTFFFHAWKMNGRYPEIIDDPVKGPEARKLFEDASRMLEQIIRQKMLIARAAIGLYPCNSVGDDVELYSDENRTRTICTLHFLRNQQKKEEGQPNLCLADFIAPKESGVVDYMGGFAVTAGLGVEEWATVYEQELNDFNALLVKLLADRLAEAFAELMHQRIRREFWGYAVDEHPGPLPRNHSTYQGIRPAPGYPACPDHSEKRSLFDLLEAEQQTGIRLTENFGMYPGASVCGYYFSHPASRYFNLGKIGKDQVHDYARRKNLSPEKIEKYLHPHLNY